MKKSPNLIISLLWGIILMMIFLGGFVLATYLWGSVHIFIVTGWVVLWLGIVVGFLIHIMRKLRWLDETSE